MVAARLILGSHARSYSPSDSGANSWVASDSSSESTRSVGENGGEVSHMRSRTAESGIGLGDEHRPTLLTLEKCCSVATTSAHDTRCRRRAHLRSSASAHRDVPADLGSSRSSTSSISKKSRFSGDGGGGGGADFTSRSALRWSCIHFGPPTTPTADDTLLAGAAVVLVMAVTLLFFGCDRPDSFRSIPTPNPTLPNTPAQSIVAVPGCSTHPAPPHPRSSWCAPRP